MIASDGIAQAAGPVSTTRVHRLKLAGATVVVVVVSYLFFTPIFEGYTLSEVGSRQNDLFPWAASGIKRRPTLHYDQTDTFYPWQVFINRALRSGEFPLWNPYSFTGHPFFANGQNGVLYPPRTFLSLIASPTRVHDLLLLSHMLACGLTMFLLLKDLRLTFGASLLGAVAWMSNSFMLSWMALEHYVVIQVWLPLAFMLTRRLMKRRSWPATACLAVVLALMFLGANVLFVEISFLVLGLYGAYLLLRQLRRQQKSAARLRLRRVSSYAVVLAGLAVVFVGLIAVQLLPTLEIVSSIERAPLSYTELVKFKLAVQDLIYFFTEPAHMVFESSLGTGEEPYHRMLFLGTPTAVLVLIGFWRKHSLVRYSRWLAIATLLVALGTPLTWVAFKLIPGLGHLKPLGRVLFLFHFGAVVLAAFGMDWLLKRAPLLIGRRWKLKRSWTLIWRGVVTCGATLTVVSQMYSVGEWVMRFQPNTPALLYPETPMITFLDARERTRILPIFPAFYGSTAMVFGLSNAGGYDSLLPDRTTRLWRVVMGSAADAVSHQPSTAAFATRFTPSTRFDLLSRLSITHIVVSALAPVTGCKGNPPENAALRPKNAPPGNGLVPLAGDWDGDGLDTIGLYDPKTATFYLWNSNGPAVEPLAFQYGPAGQGWIPLAGDWNTDGADTVALYDQSTSSFHIKNSNTGGSADQTIQFGEPGKGWLPAAGDWNLDRMDDVCLYDPMESKFHLRLLSRGTYTEQVFEFGVPTQKWIPIAGDWNDDKVDTVGLYNPEESVFHMRNINREGMTDLAVQFGPPGKALLPVVGNWNKDVALGRGDVIGLYAHEFGTFQLCVPRLFTNSRVDRVYAGQDGDIFKVERTLPRTLVLYNLDVVKDAETALKRFTDPAFDPTRAVVVETDSLAQAGIRAQPEQHSSAGWQPGSAEMVDYTLNSMKLRVNAELDGWLLVNESWGEGWTAKVDGKSVPVIPGNYAFRTLPVPTGEHTVELEYKPRAFIIGRTVSAGTVALLMIGAVGWRMRRTVGGSWKRETQRREDVMTKRGSS